MKIVHLLATGNNGGIERLIYDYSKNSKLENVFIFAWGSGSCGNKLKDSGSKVYDIDGHKIGNFKTIKMINEIIKIENPNLIIIHHASVLLRFISLFHKKEKVIVYQHNDPKNNFENFSIKDFFRVLISKCAFNHASKVIAISKFVKKNLIKYYKINNNKITVIYNGTDLDEFYYHPHAYDGTLHFVSVARLTYEKGIQNSFNLLKKIPNSIEWDYTIVGDGEYREELEELSKDFPENQIHFLGNRDDVSKILDSSDIFLHLCNCNEGFGITIIEAMAKGKICIVSDKGALPEILVNEINGYIVDNDDNAISIIESLIREREKWDTVIENANRRAMEFSITSFTENLDVLLKNSI